MSLAFDLLVITIFLSLAAGFFAGAFFLLQLVFDRFFVVTLPILAAVYQAIRHPDEVSTK